MEVSPPVVMALFTKQTLLRVMRAFFIFNQDLSKKDGSLWLQKSLKLPKALLIRA